MKTRKRKLPESTAGRSDAALLESEMDSSSMFGKMSIPGYRGSRLRVNQDRVFINFNADKQGSLIFGVVDGHGPTGEKVSSYFCDKFADKVSGKCSTVDFQLAMEQGIAEIEADMMGMENLDDLDGACLAVGCLDGRSLVTAQIGDCKIICGIRSSSEGYTDAVLITDKLHKPCIASERSRIYRCGGEVRLGRDRCQRVFVRGLKGPGNNVTRSIGDRQGKLAGMISTPDILRYSLDCEAFVIVAGSDGLWDSLRQAEVIEIASRYTDAYAACGAILDASKAKWKQLCGGKYSDDISVVVCYL